MFFMRRVSRKSIAEKDGMYEKKAPFDSFRILKDIHPAKFKVAEVTIF